MPDENITVLILRGVKQVRSIKVNRRRIRIAVAGLSLLSLVLIVSVSFNVYQIMHRNSGNQFVLSTPQNGKSTDGGGVPFTGDRVNPEPATDTTGDQASGGTAVSTDGAGDSGTPREEITAGDFDSEVVNLQNLNEELLLNGQELDVTFNIIKKSPTQEIVSGTFVIVAKTTDPAKPYVSYPKTEINPDGSVYNYRGGESFSMRFLSPKEGRILLTRKESRFEYYRIYVYSISGKLLIQKSRRIENRF